MGYGFGADGYSWGFPTITDWFDSVILSFPAPWRVREVEGKHYGTEIEDARGLCILTVWYAFGEPSARQKGDMTDVEWAEYCCDSHWESADQLRIAETIVSTRNYVASARWGGEESAMAILRSLVMEHGRWDEDIDDEIKSGGPNRRETSTEHDTREPICGASRSYREKLAERAKRICKHCGELRSAVAATEFPTK